MADRLIQNIAATTKTLSMNDWILILKMRAVVFYRKDNHFIGVNLPPTTTDGTLGTKHSTASL
jgi:hypothetical protein